VRRKDCSKLEKNFKCAFKWIVEKAEGILDDDSIYENKAKLNMLKERTSWGDYHDYGKVITCDNFIKHMVRQNKDMKNHSIARFFNICKKEDELNREVGRYGQLVDFVEEITNTTKYSERLAKTADDCELKELFNEIKSKYDMFEEVQFYGYSAHAQSFDKIIKYIRMVDELETLQSAEKHFLKKSA